MPSLININQLAVYLVEPSNVQAHFINNYLQQLGISTVQVFQDGTSALKSMFDNQPDIVISAMYLGDMAGSELIIKMRENHTLVNIAFILVSSEENPLYLDPVRQSGASAILTKPFGLKELREAIYSTLDYLNMGSLSLDKETFDIENLHVLIVDDSLSARNYLAKVLSNIGIRKMTEAKNGKIATELIEKHTFDLVITDFNMAEMDGRELTKYIRTQSWQPDIPIIMITSEQNENRITEVRSMGVSAICSKPFEPIQIKNLIEQLFAPAD